MNTNNITVKDLKNGAKLPPPIYISKPYVVLGNRGSSTNVVMMAGTLEEIKDLHYGGYYDECPVKVRVHDLYMTDNTKAPADTYEI